MCPVLVSGTDQFPDGVYYWKQYNLKCYEENKAGASDWGALLYRAVSKGLFNELTLEQKLNDMGA